MKAKATEQGAREADLQERAERMVADGYRDPDGDGRAAPSRDLLAARIFLAAGASQLWERIAPLEVELPGLRSRLAQARARLEYGVIADFEKMIPNQEHHLEELKALAAVAGPWMERGMDALTRKVGAAEFELAEALNLRRRYDGLPPGIEVPEKVTKRLAAAEAGIEKAQRERAELLAIVDRDREALAKLRARAA